MFCIVLVEHTVPYFHPTLFYLIQRSDKQNPIDTSKGLHSAVTNIKYTLVANFKCYITISC